MPTPVIYILILFPIFFGGMWALVSFLVSRMGWTRLAPYYKTDYDWPGTKMSFVSAQIGASRYSNALTIVYNQDGMMIQPILLFRLFHPTLFIPWSDISHIEHSQVLFSKFTRLDVGHPKVATIRVFTNLYRNFEDLIGSSSDGELREL